MKSSLACSVRGGSLRKKVVHLMYCFHLFCTKVHRVQNDGETVHHVLSTFDVQKVHKMCERTLDVLVQNK